MPSRRTEPRLGGCRLAVAAIVLLHSPSPPQRSQPKCPRLRQHARSPLQDATNEGPQPAEAGSRQRSAAAITDESAIAPAYFRTRPLGHVRGRVRQLSSASALHARYQPNSR